MAVTVQDPVHDFGFFRFKPSDLKYQKLTEITLDPDGASHSAMPSVWLCPEVSCITTCDPLSMCDVDGMRQVHGWAARSESSATITVRQDSQNASQRLSAYKVY